MLVRKPNILQIKTDALMERMVKLVAYLKTKQTQREWVTQLSRCGTSIGANIAESRNAQSRADFVSKDVNEIISLLTSIIKKTKENGL